MAKKISPNTLLKNNYKKRCKKNLSIDNLKLDSVSVDDLKLSKDESNYVNYINLKYLLNSVSVCQISDAYSNLYRKSPVIENLISINEKNVYGKIFTSKTNSDDWGTSIVAINNCDKEDILFIESSDIDSAIWGEIASIYAQKNGIKGVAIYGACRDVDVLKEIDFPVFALNSVPNAGLPLACGKLECAITINNRYISSNDFFYGDQNGVVVIEEKFFNEVILETLSIKIKEAEFLSQIESGNSLSELLNLD
jgi:3-hexulose-6-phosphate synthase